jgi:hypothetical protein
LEDEDEIKDEQEEVPYDGSTMRNSGDSLSARARANTNASLFMTS